MTTTTTYRRNTTVIVIAGPWAGTIGQVTGQTADNVYLSVPTGSDSTRLVTAAPADVARTPHPMSWYTRVQSGSHFCDGCQDLDYTTRARQRVIALAISQAAR